MDAPESPGDDGISKESIKLSLDNFDTNLEFNETPPENIKFLISLCLWMYLNNFIVISYKTTWALEAMSA